MRKIIIILTTLMLGVIAMTYLYFSNLNKEGNASDNSLNMISAKSGVVLTFENEKSFYEILSGQDILDELLGATKSKLLKSIRRNLVENADVTKLLKGQKVYLGLLAGEKNNIDFIIATQANLKQVDFEKLIKTGTFKAEANGDYYKIDFPDSTTCFIGLHQKSIALGSSLAAFKNAVTPATQENRFATYIKESGRLNKNAFANLYLDYNKVPLLLKNILNSNLTGELAVFNKQNTYAALNYNFSSDELLLNGYTNIQNSSSYYALFNNQPEQPLTVDQLLPERTANYSIFTMNDYHSWQKRLTEWHGKNKNAKEIEKQYKRLTEKYRFDISRTFIKYFQKQFVVFQLSSGEKLGMIKIKNGDKLAQLLLDLSTEYNADIRIFNDPGLLFGLFGEPFKKFERPYYIIVDNHLVVANYASSLQVFLNSYKSGALLSRTANYAHFKDQISNAATICIYVNNENSKSIFSKNLKLPFYKQINDKNGLRNYDAFAYQLSADNGVFLSNMLLLKTRRPIEIDSLQ